MSRWRSPHSLVVLAVDIDTVVVAVPELLDGEVMVVHSYATLAGSMDEGEEGHKCDKGGRELKHLHVMGAKAVGE